jgi:hypothetical protein
MTAHKYPAMNCNTVFDGTLIQPIGISRDIFVASKAGLPVVVSLDDVNGKSCRAKSHVAWNNGRMSRWLVVSRPRRQQRF